MTDHNTSDTGPQKEGLQAAIDFTKFLLTLSGGAMAFIIQPGAYPLSSSVPSALMYFSLTSLFCFVVCVISGLLVFSVGSVNLSKGNYDLESPRIKNWGMLNVLSFGVGFILLAIAVAIKLWG